MEGLLVEIWTCSTTLSRQSFSGMGKGAKILKWQGRGGNPPIGSIPTKEREVPQDYA